jgi:epoxyqueuosine reductase
MLITERHGSWVVLGTVVTDVEIEASAPRGQGCGSCRLCIDACPTDAIVADGVLDARRCLSYWTQAPHAVPEDYRSALGPRVYGCDICQDVCPWNRGVERRRQDGGLPEDAVPAVSLVAWLEQDGQTLVDELDRLYVPRNEARWLRRNALVALGNTGSLEQHELVAGYTRGEDAMLAETAEWALARLEERAG